jgi:hypothetical protein
MLGKHSITEPHQQPWLKDLNVRFETVKLLGDNIRKKLLDVVLGSDF